MRSARNIAVSVLNRFDPKHDYASTILEPLLDQTEEKQRATDLVFGTVRNRNAIDMIITGFADCPIDRITPRMLNIIRIASFELIYSPNTAQHAIVNEAVENAKAIVGKKQTSFVNAVLRQITRNIENRQVDLSKADPAKTLPQDPSAGCQFKTDILPSAQPEYYSCAFSLPKWLVADWLENLGTEKLRQICFASNRRPSIYIRPNTLKTTTEKLAEKFQQHSIDFDIFENSMIKIKTSPKNLPGFEQGLFIVQDIAAASPAKALNPQPGWKILDLCAAPGTKTTQLAELTQDNAKILATDIDSKRLKMVTENISRMQIKSVNVIEYDNLEQTIAKTGPFDAVMLDVPCSNTAVLAKRPEVRYRIKPSALKTITQTQKQLLKKAAQIIKPKGKILYSTCSVQKQENCRLIESFLNQKPDFKIEHQELILPSANRFDHDGGYFAILARK